MDFHRLSRPHMGDLSFLEIRFDKQPVARNQISQRAARLYQLPDLYAAVADNAGDRSDDAGVRQVDARQIREACAAFSLALASPICASIETSSLSASCRVARTFPCAAACCAPLRRCRGFAPTPHLRQPGCRNVWRPLRSFPNQPRRRQCRLFLTDFGSLHAFVGFQVAICAVSACTCASAWAALAWKSWSSITTSRSPGCTFWLSTNNTSLT